MLLVICQSTVRAKSMLQETKEATQSLVCTKKYIGIFVPLPEDTEDTFTASDPSQFFSELCPSIKKSCCSDDQAKHLMNEVAQFENAFRSNVDAHDTFLEGFEKIEPKVEEILNAKNKEAVEEKIGKDETETFRSAVQVIRNERNKSLEKIAFSIMSFKEICSGFGCAFCSPQFSNYFVMNQEAIEIEYNFENIRDLLAAFIKLLDYTDFAAQANIIAKSVYLNNVSTPNADLTKTDQFLKQMEELRASAVECKKLSLEEFKQSEKCQGLIQITGYAHFVNFMNIIPTMLEGPTKLLELVLKQGKPAQETPDQSNEESQWNQSYVIYKENEGSVNVDQLNIVLQDGTGLWGRINSMNYGDKVPSELDIDEGRSSTMILSIGIGLIMALVQ